MKCKKCGSEHIVKNGLRRGKPCFLCKDCGHQFTNETTKYNQCDKYIAILLYNKYTDFKKINDFIHTELRLSHIAKLLDCKYTTVYFWVGKGKKADKKVSTKDLIEHLKTHKYGRDIYGLLYPDRVHYQPSKKLIAIIKDKE